MPSIFKSVIRLGKLALHHCRECNLPLLKRKCSCGGEVEEVKITPPGDVRVAFEFDRNLISGVIEKQFGSSYVPDVVLLNPTPAIDKKDEVIIDGRVAGNLVYDIWTKKFKFQPRPWYASLIEIKRNYVVADNGAIPYILKTSNLMAPGVRDVDGEIKAGDEVVVLNEDMEVVATGMARMDGENMKGGRGMAVKIRWRGTEKMEKGRRITWKDVVKENEGVIESMVGGEKKFIEETIKKYDMPYAVSFSGGKDSLSTLLLTLETGFEAPLLFLNTGLEFDETIKHVHDVADKYGLELMEGKAGNKFWDAIKFFGPPARDYRWCCKTCKLGVAAMLIKKHFPRGVLSFIGQRRYESQHRAEHGKIWKNPWVGGQIAASPIQNWTALHIWIYLFMKKTRWNPLYEQGFGRIGCWLCPASDMAEFELKRHEDWDKFENELKKFSRKHNLPSEWISLGLWRWRRPPKWSNVNYKIEERRKYDIKGNEKRVENFLRILGDRKEENLRKDVIYRAINCVGCGVCISKCPQDAIYIKDGRAWIDDSCIGCMKCMDECPVIVFR